MDRGHPLDRRHWRHHPPTGLSPLPSPDDASMDRMVADNVAHALDVALGAAKAAAEGRNPFVILACGTAESVAELNRHAYGQPAPHCRHGQHFARHVHAARVRP